MEKLLPIGIQTFSEIREKNYVYVDKTQYIHKLATEGKSYFLSRPRRFGKSLLVSTLKELFKGNKKLFKELYIYNKWNWEDKYPVIVLDFGGGDYKTLKALEDGIDDRIARLAREFQVKIYSKTIEGKFTDLITEIYNKTNKKVVILIDEYDKPIISNLQNKNLENIQDKLGSFYEVLKVNDEYIKFIFLTGISKIVHVSVFSKLNNLDDLTLINEYNSICGYSQEELENNFQKHIEKVANKTKKSYDETVNQIKSYYNGYSWNGIEKVYNPYSTLLCLKHGKFSKNWFNTGTPSVLNDFPMSKYTIKAIAEPSKILDSELENPTLKNIKDEVLLFQTGYLTINSTETIGSSKFYNLRIPNCEVESALFENLINQYSKISSYDFMEYADKLLKYTIEGNCEKIIETIGDYLSPIPYELRGDDEKYYHALIFKLLYTSRLHVHSEVHSYKGSTDLVIEEGEYVIVIDFKQSKVKSIDYMIKEGLEQIEEKEYTRQYKNKKIIKGVIAFKDKEIGCNIIKKEK